MKSFQTDYCYRCENKSYTHCRVCKEGSNFSGLSKEEWKRQRKEKKKNEKSKKES